MKRVEHLEMARDYLAASGIADLAPEVATARATLAVMHMAAADLLAEDVIAESAHQPAPESSARQFGTRMLVIDRDGDCWEPSEDSPGMWNCTDGSMTDRSLDQIAGSFGPIKAYRAVEVPIESLTS